MPEELEKQEEQREFIELKDRGLAVFLAWLFPGLGHLYQGRTAKAALFCICIMGTFLYGCYLGGSSELGWGRVVYFSTRDRDYRLLHYLCQVGVGLPALPALVQASRVANNKEPWFAGLMAPPRLTGGPNDNDRPFTQHKINSDLARHFEMGTVYTMVAGLLNLLAIYDAWGGPVFSETAKKEDEDEDQEEDKDQDKGEDKGEDKGQDKGQDKDDEQHKAKHDDAPLDVAS